MNLHDIVVTPLFWVITTTSGIIFSIVANLLTPRVRAIGSNYTQAKRAGTKAKKIEYRKEVIVLQKTDNSIVSKKLDGIQELVVSVITFLVAIILLQFGATIAGGMMLLPSKAALWASTIGQSLTLLFALILFSLGWRLFDTGFRTYSTALKVKRRELEAEVFLIKRSPTTAKELRAHYDSVDKEMFGVDSSDDLTTDGLVVPKGFNLAPEAPLKTL